MKKYDNKTMEKIIFRYFNIRNIEISKFQSFYISSFKILTPARKIMLKLIQRYNGNLQHWFNGIKSRD